MIGRGNRYVPVEPREDAATLYLYRPARIIGAGAILTISINEERQQSLVNGSYLIFYLQPGIHSITASGNFLVYQFPKSGFFKNFEAGESYYILFDISMSNAMLIGNYFSASWDNSFFLVDRNYAEEAMTKLKQNNPDPMDTLPLTSLPHVPKPD